MKENMGKFRGKAAANYEIYGYPFGCWIYGYLVKMHGEWYIVLDDSKLTDADFRVDPETVGEFTGLQDSNGKEIYEGDICKVRLNSEKPDAIGVIVFTRGCYYWNEYFLYEVIHELEVINNIHDNPELLEK